MITDVVNIGEAVFFHLLCLAYYYSEQADMIVAIRLVLNMIL